MRLFIYLSFQNFSTFVADFSNRTLKSISLKYNYSAAYTYDTVWAIADVMRRAESKLNINLDKIKHGDAFIGTLLKQLMLTTNFQGVTGSMQFSSNGYRRCKVYVLQSSKSHYGSVGNYYNGKLVNLNGIKWVGGKPYRRSVTRRTWKYISYNLFLILFVFAILGILFSLLLMMFLVKYRNDAMVANSFWKLNFVIVIGALLLYVSVPVIGYDRSISSAMDWVCVCRKYLFCIGFILLVGPLLSKLYYAYKVYVNRLTEVEVNARRKMCITVVVLLLITLVVLILWQFINPVSTQIKQGSFTRTVGCGSQVG